MQELGNAGKILIFMGVLLSLLGLLLIFSDRIPWLGRLPGDILIRGKKVTLYFPIVTLLLLSLIVTLVLNFLRR